MSDRDVQRDLELLDRNVRRLNAMLNGARELKQPDQGEGKALFGRVKQYIRKAGYKVVRPYIDGQDELNRLFCAAISDLYRISSGLSKALEDAAQEKDAMRDVAGPRVFQLVSTLTPGDAVGNEVLAFKRTLKENGYATEIYANYISTKLPAGSAKEYVRMPPLRADDIVIYHFASECGIAKDIKGFPCKVILRYHNITPPAFFHDFDSNAEKATTNGLRQVKEIMPYISACLPVSEFNMRDLRAMGYKCPMKVLPILIRMEDYEREADPQVVQRYTDGRTNVLFVGRMAPNKKVEDVISAFACYQREYDPSARLFLVGSFEETDGYYQFLKEHIKTLGVNDVTFSGHIRFTSILAYYKTADVFVCMSEHEGFCVPLVEAMYFGVPVVAYDSCAVGDTLGKGGILLKSKDVREVARGIHAALAQKEKIREAQQEELKRFERDRIIERFLKDLKELSAAETAEQQQKPKGT